MHSRIPVILAVLCALVFGTAYSVDPTELDRQKSEDAALARWPEIADPQSVLSQELRRVLEYYERRGDPRLRSADAPMWLASQAATNTEDKRNPAEAQQSAMRLYPELGVLDSTLNRRFRENYERLQQVDRAYFQDPRWPIKLARQCALHLEAERLSGTVENAPSKASQPAPATTARPAVASQIWASLRKVLVLAIWAIAAGATAAFTIRYALRMRRETPHARDDWSI